MLLKYTVGFVGYANVFNLLYNQSCSISLIKSHNIRLLLFLIIFLDSIPVLFCGVHVRVYHVGPTIYLPAAATVRIPAGIPRPR